MLEAMAVSQVATSYVVAGRARNVSDYIVHGTLRLRIFVLFTERSGLIESIDCEKASKAARSGRCAHKVQTQILTLHSHELKNRAEA